MTNQEIQALYRANLGKSESTALRGVFDAGYRLGFAESASPSSPAKIVPVLVPLAPAPAPSASSPTVNAVPGVGDASAGAPMADVAPLVPKINTL